MSLGTFYADPRQKWWQKIAPQLLKGQIDLCQRLALDWGTSKAFIRLFVCFRPARLPCLIKDSAEILKGNVHQLFSVDEEYRSALVMHAHTGISNRRAISWVFLYRGLFQVEAEMARENRPIKVALRESTAEKHFNLSTSWKRSCNQALSLNE